MNAGEKSKIALKELDVLTLDQRGLGRWDEEYYLAGLYHPLRAMVPTDVKAPTLDAVFGAAPDRNVDVYIHVPFCYINCTFCHFYKEIIPRSKENSLEQGYIDAVLSEVEIYNKHLGGKMKPRSVQFGGGTPSALSVAGLTALLTGLRQKMDLADLAEAKFEFHPDMASDLEAYRQRLKVLREFGLTTAIIDLEATDPKVLKAISRGNTSYDGFIRLIEMAVEEGIESVASAYMTGLPGETLESFERTLNILSSISQIDAINLYPLMFKPSDAIFRQRRRNPSLFAAPQQKDLMMVLAGEVLAEAGFIEGPCHFFRRETHIPKQQLAKAESKTLLGLGPASFGYIDGPEFGLQYMNYPDLNRYLNAVENGRVGMWRSSALNLPQKALRSLLFGFNGFGYVRHELLAEAARAHPPGRLARVVNALVKLQLLTSDERGVALTGKGKLRNAEIMFYLSEPKAVQWAEDDPEYDLVRRYEFFPSISRDNQLLFEKFLNQGMG